MTGRPTTTLASDPDVAHLFDLLAVLPGPTEDRKFWAAVQANALASRPALEETESPGKDELDYVYEKMSNVWRVVRDQSPTAITYLAKYLLFFFSGNSPRLWRILNRVTVAEFSLNSDDGGRWWAEDVCRTAWALFVRYAKYDDDRWVDKWRYQESWLEWLPSRQAAD